MARPKNQQSTKSKVLDTKTEADPRQAEETQITAPTGTGTISADDTPAGGQGERAIAEQPRELSPFPPELEKVSVEGQKAAVAYGIQNRYIVVDYNEFVKLVRSLTFRATRDYEDLGIVIAIQRMFHIENYDEAKQVYESMLKGAGSVEPS